MTKGSDSSDPSNDGAVFLTIWLGGCGTVLAAALFAFSPAEVIDTKDPDALSKIPTNCARVQKRGALASASEAIRFQTSGEGGSSKERSKAGVKRGWDTQTS